MLKQNLPGLSFLVPDFNGFEDNERSGQTEVVEEKPKQKLIAPPSPKRVKPRSTILKAPSSIAPILNADVAAGNVVFLPAAARNKILTEKECVLIRFQDFSYHNLPKRLLNTEQESKTNNGDDYDDVGSRIEIDHEIVIQLHVSHKLDIEEGVIPARIWQGSKLLKLNGQLFVHLSPYSLVADQSGVSALEFWIHPSQLSGDMDLRKLTPVNVDQLFEHLFDNSKPLISEAAVELRSTNFFGPKSWNIVGRFQEEKASVYYKDGSITEVNEDGLQNSSWDDGLRVYFAEGFVIKFDEVLLLEISKRFTQTPEPFRIPFHQAMGMQPKSEDLKRSMQAMQTLGINASKSGLKKGSEEHDSFKVLGMK